MDGQIAAKVAASPAESEHKNWKDTALEVLHNPLADFALGVAAASIFFATRGKSAAVEEKLLPSAAEFFSAGASEVKSLQSLNEKTGSLLMSRTVEDLVEVASYHNTSPPVLDKLSTHYHPSVLYFVAGNPATAPETLSRLIDAPTFTPRLAAAMAANANVSPAILDRLADAAPTAVASQHRTAPETLSRLADQWLSSGSRSAEQVPLVNGILSNRSTPPEVLEKLPFDDETFGAVNRLHAALRIWNQPGLNPETVQRIAKVANEPYTEWLSDNLKKVTLREELLERGSQRPGG